MALVTPAKTEPLVDAVDFHVDAGGAESNVASHAAALGIPSAWVSAVGDDALGQRMRRTIADRGVSTRWVETDAAAPTGVYFKDPGNSVLYYRRGSAASRMSAASIAAVPLEDAEIVHVTGITPALSASCGALIEAVFERTSHAGAVLSFDINYRPALWDPDTAGKTLTPLAERADIVFVGLDEATTLWGCRTPDDVRAMLPGPSRLIVKDGDVGATEFDRSDTTFVPAVRTTVVEEVGAGDAFAAGYLAALLHGAGPPERLRGGHEIASLVLQSTSDFLPPTTTTARTNAPEERHR